MRPRLVVLTVVLVAAVLAVRCVSPSAGQAPDAAETVEAIQARVEGAQSPVVREFDGLTVNELMERHGVPGLSVAVIKDFEVHWAKGYGVADVESGAPVRPDTMFQAASISKPVHAMAVMKAVEDGRFTLDTDLNDILESWTVPRNAGTTEAPVTPRSLLSHTSGADDGFGFPGYDPSGRWPTLPQILDGDEPSNVGPVLFARPPFVAYKYSGGGVTLMQLAMENAIGEPFADFMRAMVLGPLGMRDSTYEQPLPVSREPQAARAHDRAGQRRNAPWHVYPEQAAAGLWTTPSDLARLAIEVQRAVRGPGGAVLSQVSAREMVTPVGVGPFGVGFTIGKQGEGWYFSHGGSNWGFRAGLLAHLRNGYGVAIMTNADRGALVIREIEARIASAYRWDTLDRPLRR